MTYQEKIQRVIDKLANDDYDNIGERAQSILLPLVLQKTFLMGNHP